VSAARHGDAAEDISVVLILGLLVKRKRRPWGGSA